MTPHPSCFLIHWGPSRAPSFSVGGPCVPCFPRPSFHPLGHQRNLLCLKTGDWVAIRSLAKLCGSLLQLLRARIARIFAFIFRLLLPVFLNQELYSRSLYFSLCLCRSTFRKEKDGMKLRNLSLDLASGFCVRISKWPPSPILSLSVDSLGP